LERVQVGVNYTILGPNKAAEIGLEASLDIQYIMSMGANGVTDAWSTPGTQPGNPENEPFLTWLLNLEVQDDSRIAKAVSASYGDDEDSVELDYAERVNAEFQKVGLRGVSLMFSSGDGGVSGSQPTNCPGNRFVPTYPAASPYVTAVGGTTGSSPESGAGLSAGGFSNRWATPTYQTAAVSAYLASAPNLPPASWYNTSGAGFPDVSAQSVNFAIVANGMTTGVSGTSCSSPSFTGIIALVNAARISAGKSTLGYLNPLFYAHPEVFTDILSGNNPGCGTQGFYAAKGWDPVTGLGTPIYTKLVDLALSL
jgi:tripeptidyl-peptidase-1